MKNKKRASKKVIFIALLVLLVSFMFFVRFSYTDVSLDDTNDEATKGTVTFVGKSENYEASVVISAVPSLEMDTEKNEG